VGIAFIVSLVLQVAYPQFSFYSGRSIAGFHKSGDFFSLSACVEFGGVTGTKRGFAISVFLTDTKLLFYLDVRSCIYVPQLGLGPRRIYGCDARSLSPDYNAPTHVLANLPPPSHHFRLYEQDAIKNWNRSLFFCYRGLKGRVTHSFSQSTIVGHRLATPQFDN
jgi:hypothetical protein